MSDVHYKKRRVFRETEDVIYYDISVEESNAYDLVVHSGPAISPPNDSVGAKQFYIHSFQDDYNRVVSGERIFELVNYNWKYPYHIVNLNVHNEKLDKQDRIDAVLFEKIEQVDKKLDQHAMDIKKGCERDIMLVDNRLRVIEKKMWTIAGALTIISFIVSPIGQRFLRGTLTPTTQSSIIIEK